MPEETPHVPRTNFRNMRVLKDLYPDGFQGLMRCDLDPLARTPSEIRAGVRTRFVAFIEVEGEWFLDAVGLSIPEDQPMPYLGDTVNVIWSDIKENEFYPVIESIVKPV